MLQISNMGNARDDGISEVVGFVLILAMLMAGVSLFVAYGVPVQGREDEIQDMDSVREWFIEYKNGLDQIWLACPANMTEPELGDSSLGNIVLTKTIDPGTAKAPGFFRRYLPILSPIKSAGSITVENSETLDVTGTRSGSVQTSLPPYPAPALVYQSQNNYWLQQEFSYQLGTVLLEQWDPKGGVEARNVSLIASPPLTISNTSDETAILVEFTLVNLSGMDISSNEFASIGSSSPVRIENQLRGCPHFEDPYGEVNRTAYNSVTLTFHAKNEQKAKAWERIFSAAARQNAIPETWWTVMPGGGDVSIRFADPGGSARVYLDVLVVDFQVGMQNVPTLIE